MGAGPPDVAEAAPKSRLGRRRLRGISASWPRRRRDPPPRKISTEARDRYCERVAGGVGLMLLPLLGAGDAPEDVKQRGVDLGVAIQLTNVLRDVGADAAVNRVYLPLEDLETCGADLDDVLRGKLTPEYVKAVEVQIARARELYASARSAVPDLPENARLVVCAIIELLEAIVDELEARGGDSLTRKLKPTKVAVLQALFRALRTSSR